MTIIIFASFNTQNAFGHEPNFEVKTSEDILKFCEFFFEEYEILGVNTLVNQHPNLPNLRACVILYNHIAWNSSHQFRDLVLISEIEKMLGNSNYIKERHVRYSDIIPDWIKREAQLWVNNEIQDIGFAYGIRTMLDTGIITLKHEERSCIENKICFNEGDFIKYSFFDKYGNNISIKHTVKSIVSDNFSGANKNIIVKDNEITIETEQISKNGINKEEIILDSNGAIKVSECCKYYEYLLPLPISLGDTISENMKVTAETTYVLDDHTRSAWLVSDPTGQNVKIVDKKSGLVFSQEFHETKVLTVGEFTKITDTNFFDSKYNMELHQVKIPKWWKSTTNWLLNEKISESEYLRALENLISRNILTV
ncbi:MAG: hypothetical protein ACW9W4_09645 [Candidatus Nitrosopumilus sp. bin_7KS]